MSPKRKLELIREARESGSVPEGALLSDYVNIVQKYMEINPPPDHYNPSENEIRDQKTFSNEDYLTRMKDRTPSEISRSIREEHPFNGGSTVVSFAQKLNESGYPYKAVVKKATDDAYSLGFAKNIDRYEKARNQQGDLYLKYYTDGSYDILDESTFNKEKAYNILPPSVKERYSTIIDIEDESNVI